MSITGTLLKPTELPSSNISSPAERIYSRPQVEVKPKAKKRDAAYYLNSAFLHGTAIVFIATALAWTGSLAGSVYLEVARTKNGKAMADFTNSKAINDKLSTDLARLNNYDNVRAWALGHGFADPTGGALSVQPNTLTANGEEKKISPKG